MVHQAYPIAMEIAGNTAIFARPDCGDSPVSYPLPTLSAVRGIFQSILWLPDVLIVPRRVELCAPICYHSYACNYGGPLRKADAILKGNNYQMFATVLCNVCYRLYADVMPDANKTELPQSALDWDRRTTSPGHAYKAIFERRLKRGACFDIPCLGWREFTPSYFGPFREETHVCTDMPDILIPSMLRETFSGRYGSAYRPVYDTDLCIHQGVLIYPERGDGAP